MAKGKPKVSHTAVLNVTVADGPDIGYQIKRFEWRSFVNGGYIIRAKFYDTWWKTLKDLATQFYLRKGRREETLVKFKIQWKGLEPTEERIAVMSDLDARGTAEGGTLTFIAIDPPSYYLNAGNSDGSMFKGRIGGKEGVISQVIKKYCPSDIIAEIGETEDNKENKWWMMRQDPKTFIASLLDWSSSVTQKKTHWIVASRNKKIIIKEQSEFEGKDFGIYEYNVNAPGANDIWRFEFLADNSVTAMQTKLLTQGISAISGQFLDKITDKGDENVVYVKDVNTPNKRNTQFKQDRGFAKPVKDLNADAGITTSGATNIIAIPEHNAGDVGLPYNKYVDGRARGMFLNMLNLVMRLKIRISGERAMDDSTLLGVSKCYLNWLDADLTPYFLSGPWLIYGFHHVIDVAAWNTDLYLARLDFDASAKPA